MFQHGENPIAVRFYADSEGTDDERGVYSWSAPEFMTEPLFKDFLTECVDTVFERDTDRFIRVLDSSLDLKDELLKRNRHRANYLNDYEVCLKVRKLCLNQASIGQHISLYPSEGNITHIVVQINDLTDPSGAIRKYIEYDPEKKASEDTERSQDTRVDDEFPKDEKEDIDREVQSNPEKPCYYPSQIEMAGIMKKRIDAILRYYHNISSLGEAFHDIEFVVYTARYKMLMHQTEKRIHHPDAGVLSKEQPQKKRTYVRMYVRSDETDKQFDELKRNVAAKPKTLFVIVSDECHWGITRDKEDKASAHNLFINEWCKEDYHKNVIVLQISATPFNLLTQNTRLPVVRCVIPRDDISISQSHYKAGDLVVLEREPDLEEHVKNNSSSKEVELHVVHWSEVELKNFERGMRMKLKSALNIKDEPYRYLYVSPDGKLKVTSEENDATDFIVQGIHGIVTLTALVTNEQNQVKQFIVTTDTGNNLEARINPQKPTKFEVKLDFGVGIVAFCLSENSNLYVAVSYNGDDVHDGDVIVSLQAAKLERKQGVYIMKPKHGLSKVSFQFYTDKSGPVEVDTGGQNYMSLNYYLSTMNCRDSNDQKIRQDKNFQNIVDKASKLRKMSPGEFTSFSNALLCAEYCYYILLISEYDIEEKICQLLTCSSDKSPAARFQSKVQAFLSELTTRRTNKQDSIDVEAFKLIREQIRCNAENNFKETTRLLNWQNRRSSSEQHEQLIEQIKEDVDSSVVACLMHFSQEEFEKITSLSLGIKEMTIKRLKENGCREMVQKWHRIIKGNETSFLVENLIRTDEDLGRMKIVRAKSIELAEQFYNSLRLARGISSLTDCFEVIRDYGEFQIKDRLMISSSPFFQRLQPPKCNYTFDCICKELTKQPFRLKCANCQHVHKSITQYEDLENLACILILVDKGRMGDTFPRSFDCLDLRLNYDRQWDLSSSSLSTLIQELGRMCRYATALISDVPYVLIGRTLFKKLRESLNISPSVSAISGMKVDRYMAKSSRDKGPTLSPLRWLDYQAQKDSYDHENKQSYCNRILLQAEPQIGKTGTYLCLIKELRLDILGKEKLSPTSPAAFDEGTFYQYKETDTPDESTISDMDEWKDWQFPYWKAIQSSQSLLEKPVGTGKYSIGGCFYTHDTEESPFILMKQEGQKPIKTGYEKLKSDDRTNGVRAWHWYHFETCAECGRLLQGKEPPLETVKVYIDGIPVNVKCSLPSTCPSFTHLMQRLKSAKSSQDDLTLNYWIFHPSHRDDPRKCTLNYHHVMRVNGRVANYVQVVVVRSEKFEAYRSTWGKVLVILQLPEELPNCECGPAEGGIGYARLFIQRFAFCLDLEYVFVIDDNMAMMSEAEFSTDALFGNERKVLRNDNGIMKMQRCSFLKPLTDLQKIVEGKEIPQRKYEPHPLKDEFEAQHVPLYTYTGPAKLFGEEQHGSYGILGLMRSIPKAVNPFAKTQVYAAVLLNVTSTVNKGVYYRPWPCWEDLRFNDDCDKAGLWVVKCNRYSFFKVQYKDWMKNLVLSHAFRWNENSSVVERTVASELAKELEEEIILEYLRNFVNTNGRHKCFKGSIGDGGEEEKEREQSPLIILGKLEANVGTEEDITAGRPVVIIPYYAVNGSRMYKNLLCDCYCNTKDKIVFIASAEDVLKRQSPITIATISTEQGICFYSEMSERNARFDIFSAADPTRHRLRWILIEASFPQDDQDIQAETRTSNEEAFESNLVDTRNVPTLVGGTSSSLQDTSKTTKSAKRSLQETFNVCHEVKRQKLEVDCSKRLDNSEAKTMSSDDEVKFLRSTCNQQTSKYGTGFRENSNDAREDGSIRSSLVSVYNEEDLVSDDKNLFHFDEARHAEVENDSDASLVSKTQQTPGRKREERNHYSSYMEGVNVVTKAIVDLWVECKKMSGSTKKVNQETGSSDLTMEYVQNKLAHFTVVQLEERDKNGYNALLKACSLPSMSSHVMQHLINTRIDINCQLLPDFDRHHPTGEGLIPGMSALSVAIKCRNVKLVQTFKKRGKQISLGIADEEGNTALHHCVLSCSKFAFSKLFPLYKEKKWKKMLNRDGKNPLHIAKELESRKLSKVKQQSVIDMRKEMTKKTKNSRQSFEDYFR